MMSAESRWLADDVEDSSDDLLTPSVHLLSIPFTWWSGLWYTTFFSVRQASLLHCQLPISMSLRLTRLTCHMCVCAKCGEGDSWYSWRTTTLASRCEDLLGLAEWSNRRIHSGLSTTLSGEQTAICRAQWSWSRLGLQGSEDLQSSEQVPEDRCSQI